MQVSGLAKGIMSCENEPYHISWTCFRISTKETLFRLGHQVDYLLVATMADLGDKEILCVFCDHGR
jgi:hypothetical protein